MTGDSIKLEKGNDQCAACGDKNKDNVTPDAFGKYVEAAIQRIQKEIPKVVINLCEFLK